MTEISVLVVEDSFYSADLNVRELKKADFTVRRYQMVSSGQSLRQALEDGKWDLILSDHSMPNFSALKALEIRNRESRDIPFIIVSEDISRKEIEDALKDGCTAYVSKENLIELRTIAADILKNK
jgi:CheY-like chemotaxis protein